METKDQTNEESNIFWAELQEDTEAQDNTANTTIFGVTAAEVCAARDR